MQLKSALLDDERGKLGRSEEMVVLHKTMTRMSNQNHVHRVVTVVLPRVVEDKWVEH